MRALIVGAGSTGGYFGGRLAQAGRDVTFLVRPARAEALARDGLRIVSPHGDVKLTPTTVTADAVAETYDVVLLTVKAFALDAAMADLAPAVGPGTMILPVLNGMRHVDALTGRFGAAALVGGVCKVSTTLDAQGRILQLTRLQELSYGELAGGTSTRVTALDAFMSDAGFTARLSADIEREMWEKWILLASMGAATCLLRGNVGEIEAVPGGTAVVLRILDEVTRVVTKVGRAPADAFMAVARSTLTEAGSPMATSMYRDVQAGLRTEADQILGDLVGRARGAGIDTPLLDAAFAQLSIHEHRVAATR